MTARQVCRHGRSLVQGCDRCLGPDDWQVEATEPRERYNLIGRRDRAVSGEHVVGATLRGQAICWVERADGLSVAEAFEEAASLGLDAHPLLVFGRTCAVSEGPSWRFTQVPS